MITGEMESLDGLAGEVLKEGEVIVRGMGPSLGLVGQGHQFEVWQLHQECSYLVPALQQFGNQVRCHTTLSILCKTCACQRE